MRSPFLEQASLWGQVFEIAVKRGVLHYLIYCKLLDEQDSSQYEILKPWREVKNVDIYRHLVKALDLTDPNALKWVETMLRHLLVLGYGLGWTTLRECLKYKPIRHPQLMAIWSPLVLPGEQVQQRDEEREKTASLFQAAFQLPGNLDLALLDRGKPARADFLLWLSSQVDQKFPHFLLCLEFSYNVPPKLADFSQESAHCEEMMRYASYIDARGVFSRVCAEVEGEEFLLSDSLKSHLSAFSSLDKPLFKLCQASAYTETLINLLRKTGRLQGACNARAIAITSNGCESLAAHFLGEPETNPKAKLMKSLGDAYRQNSKLSEDQPDALVAEIRLAFNRLVKSLPGELKRQAKQLSQEPDFSQPLNYRLTEVVENFYNPMEEFSQQEAIAGIELTGSLTKFFKDEPQVQFQQVFSKYFQGDSPTNKLPLRKIHEAAVTTGLISAQTGKVNVIALEGNPGIGKTTAVVNFLEAQPDGFMFLYFSPRVVINRDVIGKLARKQEEPSGILTITTNANLIASAPEWYKEQSKSQQNRYLDSAVVVDGVVELQHPDCSIVFLTPEQEHEIDCQMVTSTRRKRSLNEREDSMEAIARPGVLRTLAISARKLLEKNPQINRLVITGAIQGYRQIAQKTTIAALGKLFSQPANTKLGQKERYQFSGKIPTVIAMVDELAGDRAGALLVHELAQWLQQEFIDPFERIPSPFKVILLVADASLSNEIVLNSYLNSGNTAPDKVLISPTQGEAPFRVTGTDIKIGMRKHPVLHIMTNSYPASQLTIEYSIRLTPLEPKLFPDGKQQETHQIIRDELSQQLLDSAVEEIKRCLELGSEQVIFFAQDKAFLRDLKQELTSGAEAPCKKEEVEVLDQSVPPNQRVKIVQEENRDKYRVLLMTSSGARGISFPKTDWIIAVIPRFNIEAALMELAQLIYRGRGMYTDPETKMRVSGDHKPRRLIMLIHDCFVAEQYSDQSRRWLRQASDLLTLLMMLRSTILTRIKGDAGLKNQRLAFVPVGAVGDEELLNIMSDDLSNFLGETKVFLYEEHALADIEIVKRAEILTRKIFAQLTLEGSIADRKTKSYVDYASLAVFSQAVSRESSRLLTALTNTDLIIPENLSCIGPFWIEDWSQRQIEERFSFEGWRKHVHEESGQLLGALRTIYEDKNRRFPQKIKYPAKALYQFLVREKASATLEYATLQTLKTENLVVSIPIDYPHFWRENCTDNGSKTLLENPVNWQRTLGRGLTSHGLIIPVIPLYETFPWAAVAGRKVFSQLETIFSDRYFLASNELNLLNTILLIDD